MGQNPRVLVMVTSAGHDPWLTIEELGQRPIHLANLSQFLDQVWVCGNPASDKPPLIRLATGLGRLKMWHYPNAPRAVGKLLEYLGLVLSRVVPNGLLIRAACKENLTWRFTDPDESLVQIDVPTSTFLSSHRVVNNLRWAIENSNFEYLLKVTSTCLINQQPALEFIRTLPERRVYAGTCVNGRFLSGAALVFSRDVAEAVVSLGDKISHDFYDDVSLGILIRKFDVADFIDFPRLDLSSVEQAKITEVSALRESPVIRCRVEAVTTKAQPVLEVFDVVRSRLNWK